MVSDISVGKVREASLVQSQDELTLSLEGEYDPDIQNAVNSLSRTIEFSPKAKQARLEACLGEDAELLGTGSTGWASCYSKCDNPNLNNKYCTRNSGEVCKDRCDCYLGFSDCEGK